MYVLLELDDLDARGQLQPGHTIELSVRFDAVLVASRECKLCMHQMLQCVLKQLFTVHNAGCPPMASEKPPST